MDNKKGKYSSALKVGILTLSAISILIFTVLWVKGRSLSAGERIDVAFRDVNGMRAGSAVQMMGLRIGQVEEVTPIIAGKDSYVNIKFVVTEKDVEIPHASLISIQQSGIIGEQFLEVTPPRIETIFVETQSAATNLQKGQSVYMYLSEGKEVIGRIEDAEVITKSQIPYEQRQKISTKYALKLAYYVDMPGLIIDKDAIDAKVKNNELLFYLADGEVLSTPKKDLKYTVIEPLRLSDFMDLGFRATRAMLDTNDKITEILSDDFIGSIKGSVENINQLTKSANTTLDKASLLIDSSKTEIDALIAQSEDLIKSLTVLSNNINEIVSDETLKSDVVSSIKSVGKMSDNINKILEDTQTKEIITNIDDTMRNLSDITLYVNEYTKNEKLKEDITNMISSLSNITQNVSKIMDDYNSLEDSEKMKLKGTVKDISIITKNIKKFSEKLNKRFLLFRLMF